MIHDKKWDDCQRFQSVQEGNYIQNDATKFHFWNAYFWFNCLITCNAIDAFVLFATYYLVCYVQPEVSLIISILFFRVLASDLDLFLNGSPYKGTTFTSLHWPIFQYFNGLVIYTYLCIYIYMCVCVNINITYVQMYMNKILIFKECISWILAFDIYIVIVKYILICRCFDIL